jgi:hypothetical protein
MLVPPGHAIAQNDEAHPITLVGCIMRESEFRDLYGPGRSGPRGAGIGLRNEYMIVDAHEISAGGPGVVEASGTCTPTPGTFPTAYELTGSREHDAAPFVGRRVELTGMQKAANTRPVGTSGVREPSGGFDPLGHELHLFEVEIASIHEATAARAEAPVAAPAPAAPEERVEAAPPAPAPAAEIAEAVPAAPVAEPPAAPEPPRASQGEAAPQLPAEQPRQVAQAELPKTASPLPLVGLMGLLSLAAAAGMRLFSRRDEK